MFQQITLVGNLGSDPNIRLTPSGLSVCTFSLAVNESWTGADGNKQERTTWWRVTCWRGLADNVAKFCTKGKQVLIVGGKIEAKSWTDKDGVVRATLECTAETIRFLGGKGDERPATETGVLDMVDESNIPF